MLAILAVVVGSQSTRPAPSPATVPPLAASTPPATADTVDEAPRTDAAAVLTAAEAAMEAWGRFATSGDASLLEGHFDPAGPQFRQLVAETSERAREHARYRLVLMSAEARPEREGWIVDGVVRMTRDGQPAGRWRWQLHLRHDPEHGWRLWTVTDAAQRP